ncbi:MAG: zinc-finger of mitochondrial splicing suppressor 51-domain-containing protein [Olpidium bornovanus]|uniref:Zinc-finger of mitochondrial splicing suppressor 51-domain-containing protein n=1 Tax=Olpidium bornovanus TaxID=278681 RepID=A0A8H7ZRT0_9FUNG|nr:MAG: zinc-finger of mitochondrial splicing suppressor 51-domain-containing protein [Olpidium bornovanus]
MRAQPSPALRLRSLRSALARAPGVPPSSFLCPAPATAALPAGRGSVGLFPHVGRAPLHRGPAAAALGPLSRTRPTASSSDALRDARAAPRRHAYYLKLLKEFRRKQLNLPLPVVHKSKLDSLFYLLNQSPIPLLRSRAAQIEKYGSCPVCVKKHPEEVNLRQRPKHFCPDCGFPTHCSEEHYTEGIDDHAEICDVLRQINEDEHDMRCGRTMEELDCNPSYDDQYPANFTNWQTFIRTRAMPGFDEDEEFQERPARHVSKLLTYPITAAAILYKFSPFFPLLTSEGYKSMTALSHALNNRPEVSNLPLRQRTVTPKETVRVFVINPRGEASLPPEAWAQLHLLFPKPAMQIHFVGPHVPVTDKLPNDRCVTPRHDLSLHYHQASWADVHADKVAPFDLYRDVFFVFHPGFGHPSKFDEMRATLWQLLDTKCPIFCTAFNEEDLERDINSLQEEDVVDEIDWLLKPTVNPFRALRFEYDVLDLRNLAQINWSIYGIRGKRYEVDYPKNDIFRHLLR